MVESQTWLRIITCFSWGGTKMKSEQQVSNVETNQREYCCTACGGFSAITILRGVDGPVHQNLLYSSYDQAIACKTGRLHLVACRQCGFVFNEKFDSNLLDYCQDYENSQDKSGHFSEHMRSVAGLLVDRNSLRGKRFLEIGCGKGSFLKLIVDIAGGKGKGFDPSYVNEYDDVSGLSFVRDFFPGNEEWWNPDQIICRHVLEHIAQPYEFVSMIRQAIPNRQNLHLYFEVPSFEWICDNLAFWDVFYEHCNYFTAGSIASLMQRCGFAVERIESVFSGQYLSVHLSVSDLPAADLPVADLPQAGSIATINASKSGLEHTTLPILYDDFSRDFTAKLEAMRKQVLALKAANKSMAVWGAAAKGSTFLNQLSLVPEIVSTVVDINPRKQGKYVAGTGQLICAPEHLQSNPCDVVFIMNPNYYNEIRQQLQEMNLRPEFVVI
ncbi:MAG: methyltransferase domain-containing protein [Cyanobacteria bacterium SZAS LIN-5]|nr:methyltransferase domain-containing protein [Cyanobacteria bacterium SZAS LIN-5]